MKEIKLKIGNKIWCYECQKYSKIGSIVGTDGYDGDESVTIHLDCFHMLSVRDD